MRRGRARAVDAVLLDVGGVFLLPDPAVLAEAVRPWVPAASVAGLRWGHYAGIAAMDVAALAGSSAPSERAPAYWSAYNLGLVATLGLTGDAARAAAGAVGEAYRALRWTEVIPGALDGLRRLADTGVALGIVSNSDGSVEEQLLTARICQVGQGEGVPVTVVLDSHVVGVEKPDPAIFHRALDALRVPPERALHVGDTGWADIVGARAAGVRPAHLDPFDLCPVPGDHDHVRDLDDVVALIEAG